MPGELIVRFEPSLDASARSKVRRRAGGKLEASLPLDGLQLVELRPGDSVKAAAARFEAQDGVLYAEPNLYRRAALTPSDPYFDRLWGLHNVGQPAPGAPGTADADIDAPEAWDLTTGAAGVTVAVVDSGLDSSHPDLAPNVWTNPDERGGGRESNGLDDDLNGYVDDWRGWDWVDSDNHPSDENGHGTHVAGTAGARGDNGAGVAGVSWRAGLMALRVLDAEGGGTVADLVRAYAYAGGEGADVVNLSLGGGGFSVVEQETIRALPNVLFVAAAGNSGANNDATPEYPCGYNADNLICVAASDPRDELAGFSNYGASSVDLAAPGTGILSDWPGGGLAFSSGTSMATPHVAGAAALVASRSPGAAAHAIRNALLASVDVRPALVGRTATGGRLNAFRALSGEVAAPSSSPPPPAGAARDTTPPAISIRLRSKERMRTVLRRGVRLQATCSEACTLAAEATVGPRAARKLRLVRGPQPVVLGRSSSRLRAHAGKLVVVRLSGHAKRRLRRARRAALLVTVRASDPAGNSRALQRRLLLRDRSRRG